MARHKRWYDPDAAVSVRVISQADRDAPINVSRWRHARVAPSLGECLIYPLSDGPGLGLLVLLPPILWFLSLPIFDIIAVLQPLTKSDWALGALDRAGDDPRALQLRDDLRLRAACSSATSWSRAPWARIDHPRWPEWHPATSPKGSAAGSGRPCSASLIGGIPVALLLDPLRRHRLVRLGRLRRADHAGRRLRADGAGGVALARQHHRGQSDHGRRGDPSDRLGYLRPCLVASIALVLAGLGVWGLLYKMPTMWMEAVAIWAFWVFRFYAAMVASADDGTDLPRPCARPALVPAPAKMGVVAASAGRSTPIRELS